MPDISPKSSLLVVNLSDERRPAVLARARGVARALKLDIFLYRPLPDGKSAALSPSPAVATASHDALRRRAEQEHAHVLEWFRAQGLAARGRIDARDAAVPAILDVVRELEPRIVMLGPKDAHGGAAERLLSDDDSELIRLCPAPLWLARRYPEARETILAAVDPTHEDDRHGAVDRLILRTALDLARQMEMRAHLVHAYTVPTRFSGVIETTMLDSTADPYGIADYHHERTHELARAHHIPAENVHVRDGELVETVESLLETLAVDVLVIGALSRTRLRRALLGGTAEKLLREIGADILVIKQPIV